jgi:hypothetical protein
MRRIMHMKKILTLLIAIAQYVLSQDAAHRSRKTVSGMLDALKNWTRGVGGY